MTKRINFTSFGIEFFVEVSYEQDCNKLSIEEVTDVWVEGQDGENHLIKCVTDDFFKSFEGEIYKALEDEIESDKIAYAEMQMDAAREEGRL